MEAVALTMKVRAKNDPAPATPHHRCAELSTIESAAKFGSNLYHHGPALDADA
jgi:hypothetical protein